MRKLFFFTILAAIGLSGCSALFPSQAQRETRQTEIAATYTQRAEDAQATLNARGPTSTPRPSILQLPTRTPRPTVTPTPTSTPIFILYTVKVKYDQIPYFTNRTDIEEYEKGNSKTTKGNFGKQILNILDEWKGEDGELEMLLVLVQGRMLSVDLGMTNLKPEQILEGMEGNTTCESHKSGHVNNDNLTHCHFLANTSEGDITKAKIIGTVPSGIRFVVLSNDIEGRFVKVRLLDPFWVRVSDVEFGGD